jgi:hypothetical protein
MRHLPAINVARYQIEYDAIPLENVADMLHRSGYPALIYQWRGSARVRPAWPSSSAKRSLSPGAVSVHPRRVVEVLAGTIYSDEIAVTEQPTGTATGRRLIQL